MSGKKRAVNSNVQHLSDQIEDDTSEEESMEEDTEAPNGEVINVDFEGRNPVDSDFHGIKTLLNQLFLRAHVNLSELTEVIISQSYVGSVVKQAYDENIDDDDEDDDDDANDVFGITSVLNLTEKQNLECVKQLRQLLSELCTEHADAETKTFVRNLLSDNSKHVGLLINERFVNIPAQIVVPLLRSLSLEINRAKEKKMPYNFDYYILISKLYKLDKTKKKSKKNKQKEQFELIWSNPEEELIDKECSNKFEFCVKNESDTGLTGAWNEDDTEMIPYRRVLILEAKTFETLVDSIEQFVK